MKIFSNSQHTHIFQLIFQADQRSQVIISLFVKDGAY